MNAYSEKRSVTGTMVKYYVACKRKLYYHGQRIAMEHTSSAVRIGEQIQEESYERETKDVLVDGIISFDVLRDQNTIYEVKKSSSFLEPARTQLKYYLWYMKTRKNAEYDGVLAIPRERKREEFTLEDVSFQDMEELLRNIRSILAQENAPERREKEFCERCSFYELCWI